jgi:aminoglycoside-2''-adenylyltransferase
VTMGPAAVLGVLDALEGAGVRAGVTGGWGIDALLGRETRPHDDVDLGIADDAVAAAIDALAGVGYRVELDERPGRVQLNGPTGRVDLHPIRWEADGHGRQVGLHGEVFDYPPGSLDAPGRIAGRIVRCGTPALQLAFHEGYAPRDHDRRDMQALAEAFGLPLPAAYVAGARAPGSSPT